MKSRCAPLVGVMLVAVLVACGEASPTGSVEPSGSGGSGSADQVLRLAYAEAGPLDPHLSGDTTMGLLVRGLTWFDEDLGTVPGLAESWDITDGGATITFHLREAAYSSGEPITANDFVFGWQRLLDPRTGSSLGFLLSDVAGAGALLSLQPDALPTDAEIDALLGGLGLNAPDPRTFVVQLRRPAAYFPTAAANWVLGPISADWIVRPGATEAGGFWSSGPFVLTEWVHDQRRILEPNPMWWGAPVGLRRIEMTAFTSEDDAAAAFGDGELDILDLTARPTDPDLAAVAQERPGTAFWHIAFDMAKADSPTARSPALRRALGFAIDHEALNEIVGFVGPAAGSPIPPGVPGHDPELTSVFDPDEAVLSFSNALDELGLDSADELDLTFLHGTLVGDGPQYLARQWNEVLGLEVEFVGLEPEPYFERLFSGRHEFDMFWLLWFADYPHPQSYLEPQWACGSATNLSGYCNPVLDDLLAEAAGTVDQADQLALYGEAQRVLLVDEPSIFVQWPGGYVLVAPQVQGLVITPIDAQYGWLFPEQISIGSD